jgi:hypothetical protein
MIVIKNVYGGSQVYIKNVFANAENIVVVYNGGDPIEVTGNGGGGTSDHGALTGLADDDHTQYLNNARGDLRYEPLKGADDNFVTDAEKTKLANLSGTNTGDQDISGKQDVLVSGTNIKTINSSSILGSGNLVVTGTDKDYNLTELNGAGAALIAQAYNFQFLTGATARSMVSQRAEFIQIYIPSATTITGVTWAQVAQGNYTGNNYNGWGLYSASGGTLTLVASTTTDTEIWKGTAYNKQTKAFSSPYSAAAGLYYLVALYCSSAQTTAPTLIGKTLSNVALSQFFTNSNWFCFSTTGQTALAASYTASTLTQGTTQPWAAVY